jgi:hypothetical protein
VEIEETDSKVLEVLTPESEHWRGLQLDPTDRLLIRRPLVRAQVGEPIESKGYVAKRNHFLFAILESGHGCAISSTSPRSLTFSLAGRNPIRAPERDAGSFSTMGPFVAICDAKVTLHEEGTRREWKLPYATVEPPKTTSSSAAQTTPPAAPPQVKPGRGDSRCGEKVSFEDKNLQTQVGTVVRSR